MATLGPLVGSGGYYAQQIKTGDPVIDAVMSLGGYAVVAVAAFLIVKYLYQQRERDWSTYRTAAETQQAALKEAWTAERSELIGQRKDAQELAEQFRLAAERAGESIKAVMDTTSREAMAALKESQSALGEAAVRVQVQSDQISNLRQELDLLKRMAGGTGGR